MYLLYSNYKKRERKSKYKENQIQKVHMSSLLLVLSY